MAFTDLLGRAGALRIRRLEPRGALLGRADAKAEGDEILLPRSEAPEDAKVGDDVPVFVYLDSEDRPIATTRTPKLELGEVTFLEVTALTKFGAFVDWGLPKELLVPFAEQTAEMHVGGRYAIGLYLDESGRLAGTMRVAEMLAAGGEKIEWELDEWVDGEAWRWDREIGLFVIVERAFVGLVPATEPHGLSRGEAAQFRITNILPDGKIELSRRRYAHEEIDQDATKILRILTRSNPPAIGDKSTPEEINAVFGISKKAFKRAVGRLLKEGSVAIDDQGILRVTP